MLHASLLAPPHATCLMPRYTLPTSLRATHLCHTPYYQHPPHATNPPRFPHTKLEGMLASSSASSSRGPGRGSRGRRAGSTSPRRLRSRSRSPRSRQKLPRRSPPRRNAPPSAQRGFSSGADQRDLAACAICLGRYAHGINKCKVPTMWNGKKAYCTRSESGRLIDPNGNTLCSDWQRPNSCRDHSHDARHRCSGCGKPDHGAQKCPLVQSL